MSPPAATRTSPLCAWRALAAGGAASVRVSTGAGARGPPRARCRRPGPGRAPRRRGGARPGRCRSCCRDRAPPRRRPSSAGAGARRRREDRRRGDRRPRSAPRGGAIAAPPPRPRLLARVSPCAESHGTTRPRAAQEPAATSPPIAGRFRQRASGAALRTPRFGRRASDAALRTPRFGRRWLRTSRRCGRRRGSGGRARWHCSTGAAVRSGGEEGARVGARGRGGEAGSRGTWSGGGGWFRRIAG
jgi:hypothetical protein